MTDRRRKFAALAAIAVALAAAGFWYARWRSKPDTSAYQTQPLTRGELMQAVSANGTLNPVTLVSVGTQVSGTVNKLYVDFNSEVEEGEVLLTLEDSLYAAQARQSQASIRNAQASLELAHANEARVRALYAQEYVSKQELDTAVAATKSAVAQLALARAQGDKDRVNLAYTIIHSPISGVVVDRLIDVGQTVAASFQTPTLIKIAQDLTKMQIDSSFAEADIGQIKIDQPARFSVDAFPNRQFNGKVNQIRLNPTTVQNVVTYDVVVSVDNADLTLLPGMTAYVSIEIARRENVLMVPNAALRFRPPQPPEKKAPPKPLEPADRKAGPLGTVYVLRDGQPQAVRIRTGITDSRNTEVLEGPLSEGDSVIVGSTGEGAPATPSGMRFRVM